MPNCPILARELVTRARQPRTYRRRSSLATLMLQILGAIYAACYFGDQGRMSVQEMAAWLQAASAIIVFYQFNLTIWLVPIYVAGGIAEIGRAHV